MTNEEMQQVMAFILEQQARASVKIDALADVQKNAEERWTRTDESIRALLSIAEIHEREITTVGQGLERLTNENPEARRDYTGDGSSIKRAH